MEMKDMYAPPLLSISLVLFPFLLLFLFIKNKSNDSLPPGNSGWPVIGETIEFLTTGWSGHPEKFIFDRIFKYSSHVFSTHLIGARGAVFCGASGNKFIFSNENKLVRVWWPSSLAKIFPSLMQTSFTQQVMESKKFLPNFLKPEALQSYIGVIDYVTQQHFLDEWEGMREVTVYPLVKNYTFRVACRFFLSIEGASHIAKLAEQFNELAEGLISIPINFPGSPLSKASKAANFIRKELFPIIHQRRIDMMEGTSKPTHDILSHMLTMVDKDGNSLDELEVADRILAMLLGGLLTSSSACTSLIKYLAEFPQVYEKVYNEQIEIAISKKQGELLKSKDLQNMKYSWNVVCEVLRLDSPVQGAFRETLNDFTFNGFKIPKGWTIYWSASSTHLNHECFPDPTKFDPTRFDGVGPAPYTFVPFGGGPRMCPGKDYFRVLILVFMHNLVKRFRFEKIIPDEKIVFNPVPIPAMGMPIKLHPHLG